MLPLRGQPPVRDPILRALLRLVKQRPDKTAKKRDRLHTVPLNRANVLPTNLRFVENQQHREHIVQQWGFHCRHRRVPYSHQPFEGNTSKPREPMWRHLLSKIANRPVLQVTVDKCGEGNETLDSVLKVLGCTSCDMGHDTFQELQIRKKVRA